MIWKGRRFKLSPRTKKIVLIVLLLLVIDILLAGLGSLFLSETIWFFDKSATQIFSDLLFLEGAIIFAIGSFLAAGISDLLSRRSPSRLIAAPESSAEDVVESRPKQYSTGTILMIVGASFMGSSIAIATLFL